MNPNNQRNKTTTETGTIPKSNFSASSGPNSYDREIQIMRKIVYHSLTIPTTLTLVPKPKTKVFARTSLAIMDYYYQGEFPFENCCLVKY